jgi:hypothetical protein
MAKKEEKYEKGEEKGGGQGREREKGNNSLPPQKH